jgi:hypothetical protein
MSDYIPDPRDPRDPLRTDRVRYDNVNYVPERSGTGTYGIVAALVIAVLVVGFLFFGGPPKSDRMEQAQAPATTIERTTPAPAPAMPMPATPPAAPKIEDNTPRQQ